MMELLGIPTHFASADDITVDAAAKLIETNYPEAWKATYTKHYDAPGNYCGPKAPAVTFASAAINRQIMLERAKRQRDPADFMRRSGMIGARTLLLAGGALERFDWPTFYVGRSLLDAMRHTDPPKNMMWKDLQPRFPGMIFMLPQGKDAILETPSQRPLRFFGFAFLKAGLNRYAVTGERITLDNARVVVFWSICSCTGAQDCTFRDTTGLKPSGEWIDELTVANGVVRGEDWAGGDFAAYISGLIANLILFQQARPKHIEHGEKTKHTLKSGVPVYTPSFLGRSYFVETHKEQRSNSEATGAHFTLPKWRGGHYRRQHFGEKNQQEKIVLIDPYICLGAGLVRPEQAMTTGA